MTLVIPIGLDVEIGDQFEPGFWNSCNRSPACRNILNEAS